MVGPSRVRGNLPLRRAGGNSLSTLAHGNSGIRNGGSTPKRFDRLGSFKKQRLMPAITCLPHLATLSLILPVAKGDISSRLQASLQRPSRNPATAEVEDHPNPSRYQI